MPETISLRERRKLVRDFREQLGWTLRAFGKLAEVSHPMLSQFETGEGGHNLSEEAWQRVLRAMGMALTDRASKRQSGIHPARKIADRLGVETFEGLRRYIGPEARAALKNRRELIERLQDGMDDADTDVKEWLRAELMAVVADEKALALCARLNPAIAEKRGGKVTLYNSTRTGKAGVIAAKIANVQIIPNSGKEPEPAERLAAAVESGDAVMTLARSPEHEAELRAMGWTDDLSKLPKRKSAKPAS